MDDKIKIYESLLDEKASLEKKCFYYSLEYARVFGINIETLFELKVEVVTLKKKIAYCVRKQYCNETIYAFDLEKYIDEEILEYQKKLRELIEYNKYAKSGTEIPITHDEHKRIKKLYHEIAHLIHPDLHPEYKDDEELTKLWNDAVNSYKCNDFKSLSTIYDTIIIKVSENEIFIENIEEKIKTLTEEIEEIKKNEPYTYKFILDDEEEMKALNEELESEIKDYKEYKENLEKELSQFNVKEGYEA